MNLVVIPLCAGGVVVLCSYLLKPAGGHSVIHPVVGGIAGGAASFGNGVIQLLARRNIRDYRKLSSRS